MPVLISKKTYGVSIFPESIIVGKDDPMIFSMVITNPSKEPLAFSLNQIRIYTAKKDARLLSSEEVTACVEEGLSGGKYKLNKEDEAAFTHYVEEKIKILRDKLLNTQTIEPSGRAAGLIYIQTPSGVEELTIEVSLPNEKHKFDFHVIES